LNRHQRSNSHLRETFNGSQAQTFSFGNTIQNKELLQKKEFKQISTLKDFLASRKSSISDPDPFTTTLARAGFVPLEDEASAKKSFQDS